MLFRSPGSSATPPLRSGALPCAAAGAHSNVFENSSVDNNEVLSAETSNSVLDERRVHNLDSLRFCYNDICKEVPFSVFDSWIIDGKLDRMLFKIISILKFVSIFSRFMILKKLLKTEKVSFIVGFMTMCLIIQHYITNYFQNLLMV